MRDERQDERQETTSERQERIIEKGERRDEKQESSKGSKGEGKINYTVNRCMLKVKVTVFGREVGRNRTGVRRVPCMCGAGECVGAGEECGPPVMVRDNRLSPIYVLDFIEQRGDERIAVVEAGGEMVVLAVRESWLVCPQCHRADGAEILCRVRSESAFSSRLYEVVREAAVLQRRSQALAERGGRQRRRPARG